MNVGFSRKIFQDFGAISTTQDGYNAVSFDGSPAAIALGPMSEHYAVIVESQNELPIIVSVDRPWVAYNSHAPLKGPLKIRPCFQGRVILAGDATAGNLLDIIMYDYIPHQLPLARAPLVDSDDTRTNAHHFFPWLQTSSTLNEPKVRYIPLWGRRLVRCVFTNFSTASGTINYSLVNLHENPNRTTQLAPTDTWTATTDMVVREFTINTPGFTGMPLHLDFSFSGGANATYLVEAYD